MKIAITGGAGFIGSHLTRAYLDAGHDVFVVDTLVNGSRKAIDRRARFYAMDIRDGTLRILFQKERPDLLSHHAAQREYVLPGAKTLADADIHVHGLLNVLDSCVSASVGKIIFASAGNTLYGPVPAGELPVREDATLHPYCSGRPSDISKVAGEWYVRYYARQYGLTYTILRYADVYGESDYELAQHPLSYFMRMLAEGRSPVIRGAANKLRDHIFIDDLVRANLLALEHGKNATLHISSGEGHSLEQIYSVMIDLLKSSGGMERHTIPRMVSYKEQPQDTSGAYREPFQFLAPTYLSASLDDAYSIVLDNQLAWQVLGWRPEVSFSYGVGLAVERLIDKSVMHHAHALDESALYTQEPAGIVSEVQVNAPSLVSAGSLAGAHAG